ncbi:PHD finger protein 7-like, partial [Rissa tridactyla]|uniref:PHD finger protein 7-like n=1 Tax=Rissa tridactyla TaxID=75485 RepID=UPI0023BAEFC3
MIKWPPVRRWPSQSGRQVAEGAPVRVQASGADVTVATVTRWRQGYKKAAAGHQSDLERVSGGAFGGDSPALLGQGLSKRSPSSCAMSATEEMAPDSMEQACMLCRRAEADPGICGRKLQNFLPTSFFGNGTRTRDSGDSSLRIFGVRSGVQNARPPVRRWPSQSGRQVAEGAPVRVQASGADVTVATVTRWRQGYKKAAAGHQSDLERVSGGAFGGDSPALLGQGLSKRSPSSCAMSATEEMAPDSMEQACMLCRRAEADPGICGRKLQKHGLCAHEFCLFFANQLFRQWDEDEGFRGFVPEDIRRAIRCAERKYCFVCGESGATITCSMMGCRRSFHLPCAGEGGCVTQFLSPYRSLCWEHRPEQAVEAAPEENTTCLICLEPVGDQKSYGTMVCPACKHAWFHRGCIQAQALNAGIFCFRCPLCRDRSAFLPEMLIMGIRMPFSLPSWEDGQAYAGERERHSRCDASVCLCPGGREQAEEGGPWELLLCSSCAAEGTHRHCSSLSSSTASWECDSCAGLGTASSATS